MALAVRRGRPSPDDRRARGRTLFRGDRIASRASHVRARLLFLLLDAVAVVATYGLAEVLYFRDRPPAIYWRHFVVFIAVALVVHLSANWVFGLYGRIWRYAGIQEARQVLLSALSSLVVLAGFKLLWELINRVDHTSMKTPPFERIPLVVIVVGCSFLTMVMGALRFQSRLFAWQRGTNRVGLRIAVIGSRDAGAEAIREMLRTPVAGHVPVAVFDDDGRGHGLSLIGVPVVGGIEDIPAAASRYTIQQVLLTIPNPSPELVERALRASEAAGLPMKILPSARDMAGREHTASIREAREPRIEDLLGRSTVSTDLNAVRRSLTGMRVLITGAGGSIGSEIARQVAEFNPALLLLLDHDETHLHDVSLALSGSCEQLLVDVSDRAAVFEAFLRHRPDVVFHAAAHKHVPVLEDHPVEAASVNVCGTENVVQAATAAGVRRFVLISTDKAVEPISVMGASKRVAEEVVLAHAALGTAYSIVRFGNVLGSRGSVIPTFARQIAAGGPITVTDPRMTRFFMSVEEAVQLVLQASVLSQGHEIFMLEMGEPVRILDLAQRMVRLSGREDGAEIPIKMIGRRPGEKLHEQLHGPDEAVFPTAHPFIRRISPAPHPEEEVAAGLRALRDAVLRRDGDTVRGLLFALSSAQPVIDPTRVVAEPDPDPVSA
jgi:FlaA1/EpsC-like NDP-sugar epimerase